MVGKTKTPTRAERAHMEAVQQLGCLACRIEGRYRPAEIHHATDSGRRVGHYAVIPLCEWHHRAVPPADMRPSEALVMLGPSLARHPDAFRRHYGTDEELARWAAQLAEQPAMEEF